MRNNEFVIDEWHEVDDHKEHHGSTRFKEFDGTERETPTLEGGIIGGLQDQDWDTADRDYARSYKFIYNKIDSALNEAAANALGNLNISLTAAKEVAADAIAKAGTECKTLYDFYEYDDLAKYNLDAAIIDWQLFGKKKVTP